VAATLFRSIFAQPSAEEVWAQHDREVEQLEAHFPEPAEILAEASEDILAFAVMHKPMW